MRRALPVLALAVACLSGAQPGFAQAMTKSLRPTPRPVATATETPTAAPTAIAANPPQSPTAAPTLRPRPRPAGLVPAIVVATRAPSAPAPAQMTPLPRPLPRPADLLTKAALPQGTPERSGGLFGKRQKKEALSATGQVCGDRAIRGERLARISSPVQGCGIEAPVRVTSIDGIRLSQAATLDCDTAIALKRWIDTGLRPAFGRREVVELKIAAHYICRPRNNKKGAKVSEHGRGRAIDIAGIVTSDGRTQMVLKGFDKTLQRAYKAGCGIFATTLGPGSDGYHEDHMHFDVAIRKQGSAYCR